LGFQTPGFAQPARAESQSLRIRFEGNFQRFGNSYFGPAAALAYEAVRSQRPRRVQWTMKWLDGNQTPTVARSITFDLYTIEDFATCASLAPLSQDDFAPVNRRNYGTVRLFDVTNFDHEFIRGRCVAAKPAAESPASHIVKIDSASIVVVTGNQQRSFGTWARYEALAALDIGIASSGHDLWSRDGMARSLDPLSDADLVRGINASAAMRLAALRVLAERVKQPITRECRLVSATLLKPTGPAVVQAILDKNTLSQANSELRLQTMRALAASRPTTGQSRLSAQLLAGLELPIEDFRPPAEIARQERVQSLIGNTGTPEGRPAFQDNRHFEVAAALALLSGNEASKVLTTRLESHLKRLVLRSLADQPCTDALVANASFGADVTMELIKQVDGEKFAIPDIQRRIHAMARIAAHNSSQMRSWIRERCSRSEGFLPNGDRRQAAEFCRVSAP
jgi:hypothetical protein